MRRIIATAATSVALALSGAVVTAAPAEAKVVKVAKAKPSKVAKWGKDAHTFKRVEPYRFRQGVPTRLSVEMWSGAEYVVTPCKREDGNNCFWWASGRGNGQGASFVVIRNRVHYI